MANQARIKIGVDAGRGAAIFHTSQPIVNTLIIDGEILLGTAVVIDGLAVHAKDNISRRNVLICGIRGTIVTLGLGACSSNNIPENMPKSTPGNTPDNTPENTPEDRPIRDCGPCSPAVPRH